MQHKDVKRQGQQADNNAAQRPLHGSRCGSIPSCSLRGIPSFAVALRPLSFCPFPFALLPFALLSFALCPLPFCPLPSALCPFALFPLPVCPLPFCPLPSALFGVALSCRFNRGFGYQHKEAKGQGQADSKGVRRPLHGSRCGTIPSCSVRALCCGHSARS